jgi:hypothetical protein
VVVKADAPVSDAQAELGRVHGVERLYIAGGEEPGGADQQSAMAR